MMTPKSEWIIFEKGIKQIYTKKSNKISEHFDTNKAKHVPMLFYVIYCKNVNFTTKVISCFMWCTDVIKYKSWIFFLIFISVVWCVGWWPMSRMINILKKKIVPSLFVEEVTQAGPPKINNSHCQKMAVILPASTQINILII